MPFDPKPYADGIRALNAAERLRIEARARMAVDEATRLARLIAKTDPAVRRVYLFGSLATGVPRNEDFDIDLAIEGGDVFTAMECAETSGFHVDIAQFDRLPEHIRSRVRDGGRLLFDRSAKSPM